MAPIPTGGMESGQIAGVNLCSLLCPGWLTITRGADVTVVVRVWFADIFLSGVAGLAVCLVLYLLWLHFHEKWQQHKDQQERRRQRLAHWGHEG